MSYHFLTSFDLRRLADRMDNLAHNVGGVMSAQVEFADTRGGDDVAVSTQDGDLVVRVAA